jgi:hypothetical protein
MATMKPAARFDIVFDSARFNLSQARESYINDCCFGDDTARWLVETLRERNFEVTEPDQEDWGWYFEVDCAGSHYLVGVGGNADDDAAGNQGRWRLIVEKRRTLWEKLKGANLLHDDDPLVAELMKIVSSEPELSFVGIE